MSFSKRMGYEPPEPPLQLESMNAELRTAIWNCLYIVLVEPYSGVRYLSDRKQNDLRTFIHRLWMNHVDRSLDESPSIRDAAQVMKAITETGEWRKVYDLIEFVLGSGTTDLDLSGLEGLADFLNWILERENAGYRIAYRTVVPITSNEELGAVGEAMGSGATAAGRHVQVAVEMLRNREAPDYRNSIKESVSAVEAACRAVTGNPRATLGDALKVLRRHQPDLLHPALADGLTKLYGYTSDGKGIRHALLDGEDDPSFSEAKFMLVACSAFVNLLAELPASDGSSND
jgi:AbiJ N-terminal domain 4